MNDCATARSCSPRSASPRSTLLAGPAAYAITTVRNPGSGSIVAAGPSTGVDSAGRAAPHLPAAGGPAAVPRWRGAGSSGTADRALTRYLTSHRGSAEYIVAAFGSQSSASIIIATGEPVITIGGFNGGDPAPTLTQFEHLVAEGKVRYVLVSSGGGPGGGAGGGPGGGAGGTSSISTWVVAHGKEVPSSAYGSSSGTLYDVSHAT